MTTALLGQTGVSINRGVAGVGTTDTSTALTAPAGSFFPGDAGRPISGTGIPAGATIASVESSSAATLSAAATATGTITAAIGGGNGDMYLDGKRIAKTNDKTVTGIGTEGPSAIPGGTIADGRVRGTVDTRNAGYIGAAAGPDPEAPREWT
jgi:hypothetical protein